MDILELLKKNGLEIAEDKIDAFNGEFRKSYKSAAELRKVKEDLANLQEELDNAKGTIEEYKKSSTSGSEEVEKLKKEVETYKATLADRDYIDALNKGLNGIEFANDRVKGSVLAEIKEKGFKIENGELAGLSDYLKDLYKKEPETFKEVDSVVHTWGGITQEKQETKKYNNYFGSIM